MSQPSITIVTPCLNARATIEQTLRSVAEQQYDGEVEHLVVDGGSTDGTLEVLAESGVRYVSEPDEGLSDAMNKGIGMARGELIGWLNADDWYLGGALDAVGRAFAGAPEALWVTGPCPIVDSRGREIRRAVTAYKNVLLRHWSYGLHLTQNFVSCPATFFRRSAFERVGPLEQRYRYSMDYDLWLKLGRLAPPLVLDRPLAVFRMAEGSLSMSGFDRQFAEHADIAREHGDGHRAAVLANLATSRAIVATYAGMRALRRLRG